MPKRYTKKEFVHKAKIIHSDNGTCKFTYPGDYVNGETPMMIECNHHGIFSQRPHHHLAGHGCPRCGFDKIAQERRKSKGDFEREAKLVHENKYSYSEFIYLKENKKGTIICKKHGAFNQSPTNHLSGQGCPKCKSSHGERLIEKYLKDNNVKYETQRKFSDCKDKGLLKFDFYLPDYNLCIEFNGEQHYKPIKFYGGHKKYLIRKRRDMIKKDYCSNNKIQLLIVKYVDKNNVNNILDEYFNELV